MVNHDQIKPAAFVQRVFMCVLHYCIKLTDPPDRKLRTLIYYLQFILKEENESKAPYKIPINSSNM
ncbi:hypothetical protein J2Z83_002743 [Virgibacillus natechei]|uniref:Uncharacterized protein n=1 Tax=Virgibacillus natechei TaxID=1216297 RepID=A0ABS4II32_9BACI|nr:hypothetical protein [Virgibacillus natechei]